MIGLADDLGVRLNSGRPGAARGPNAFREALSRYGVAHPQGWTWPIVLDAGDVVPAPGSDAGALDETHRRVTAAVTALLDAGLFPIAIGGGHDLTFPFVRAVAARWPKLSGLYFDAHLDVRDTPGSGMPFRSLVERCGVRELRLHGFNPLANAREHVEWFRAHGGRIAPSGVDPLMVDDPDALVPGSTHGDPRAPFPRGDCFVSFDLDVLDAAHAPGVSAVNPAGWTVAAAETWAFAAGRNPRVRCFDIMELNPEYDADGRTARVAAHLFLSFLRGFAERPA